MISVLVFLFKIYLCYFCMKSKNMSKSDYLITEGHHTRLGIKYYFTSNGESNIIKAIDYSYSAVFDGKRIYNLAFGDYDPTTDQISDDVTTQNGDVYKVLNTVLSTIPLFFNSFPDSMMIVRGSDSTSSFIEKCREACIRSCLDTCRKSHRRINIYCGYVNKNFDVLKHDFNFYGGVDRGDSHILIEDYDIRKKYQAVFVTKKNV